MKWKEIRAYTSNDVSVNNGNTVSFEKIGDCALARAYASGQSNYPHSEWSPWYWTVVEFAGEERGLGIWEESVYAEKGYESKKQNRAN